MKNPRFGAVFGFFCLVLSAVIAPTRADEVIKTFPGGGANDLINSTKPPGHDLEPMGSIKIIKQCRTEKGALIKDGEKGYQECLKDRMKRPARSPIPEAPADAGNQPHSSTTKPATK